MKITRILWIASCIALVASVSDLQAQRLKVRASGTKTVKLSDRVGKNQFTWISTAPVETINGTAEGIEGAITLDPRNLSTIRGTVSAKVETMKSGNDRRDEHLRSATWLDAAKFPTISFTITSVSGVKVTGNQAKGNATGTFTMHGVSKALTIPFTLRYVEASTATAKRAPGDLVMFTATFKVSLKDFNVAGSQGTIGSKVGETITVKAQLFGSTGL